MKHILLSLMVVLALPGCATLFPKAEPTALTGPAAPDPAVETTPSAGTTALGAQAVRAEVLDTTSAAEKAAALAAPAASGERELGRVVVTLGPPAEQGLWLRTALVTAPVQGRVVTASGQSLTLELRPGTGGALLSLAAFQALGLSLTGLPEVSVFGP
jgi:phage terminase large subunit-like protein